MTTEIPRSYQKSERLILAYRGRLHFQEAVSMAAKTEGSNVGNALVHVAREMVDVGVAPSVALEGLTELRGSQSTLHSNNFIDECIVYVHAMMGNLARIDSLMPDLGKYRDPNYTPRNYLGSRTILYAAEAMARKGENPAPIIEGVIAGIASGPDPHWGDDYHGRVMNYVDAGKTLYKVGLDPNIAFSKAKDELIRARAKRIKGLDPAAYETLASGYITVEDYEAALKVIDLLDTKEELNEWHHTRHILQWVVEAQKEGDLSRSLELAEKFGWKDLEAKVLARRSLFEARQREDPGKTIAQVEGLIDRGNPYFYREVLPQIYVALRAAGNTDMAQVVFNDIEGALANFDMLDKPEVGFALAEAVDETGDDATPLYRQAFTWLEESRDEEPEFYIWQACRFEIYEDAVRRLIDRGHLDLAKEFLDRYPDDPWTKSGLLTKFAAAEARRGLSGQEITSLSDVEIRTIIATNNETAKDALVYFGRF